MKKIISIFLFLIVFTIVSVMILNSGSGNNTLYLLNWGEYINQDLISRFEKEYNCVVVEETVTSSETMYQKIVSNTTSYDVAIPGDYMVTKLTNEGLLKPIDINNPELPNLHQNDMFVDELVKIRDKYNFSDEYSLPYFWGAYSILYNTRYEETEKVIQENGFNALFNRDLFKEDVKIGMYSTARWTLSAYLMSQNLDPNTEDFDTQKIVSAIKSANIDVWGDDQLKRQTATGKLDLAFTQLGDFFDGLWLSLEEGLDVNENGETGLDALSFNVNVPKNTSAFFDAMVIPRTSKNYTLANQFINFMLEPQNAYENALAIGYCPTLNSVVNLYQEAAKNGKYYYENKENPSRSVSMQEFIDKYPVYLNPLVNSDIEQVTLFEPKTADYMTLCETIINQAKSNVATGSNTGAIICYTFTGVVSLSIVSYVSYSIYRKHRKKKNAR